MILCLDGQVHLTKDKTGGHQEDPFEILVFNLTTLHLWGCVLGKLPETSVIVYVDDGYIKTKLNVTLQVLTEVKCVLKEDVALDLNVSKTSVC